MLWLWAAVLAGVGYIVGTVLHEVSHVIVVVATGTPLKGVSWRHTTVFYNPESERVDWLVKAAPVAATPFVAGAMLWAVESVWGGIFAIGILSGYIPRDSAEYRCAIRLCQPPVISE